MTLPLPAAALDHPFVLESIVPAPSPMHPGEDDWHRYVIKQGGNRIVGYRRGNARGVKSEVDALVVQLNDRRSIKTGRKHITLGPSKPSAAVAQK